MRVDEVAARLAIRLTEWQRSVLIRDGDDPERGDVPGWVFVTLMSAALVGVLYVVAAEELETILRDALAAVIP